ncbi:General secretion pathway protein J [uncultured Candidatus Thioglobus sp.]|nr:General secretion pathway protein J [uncultured Candidatus Thioglobus sp.]
MKQKGFTLIELLIAIAILSVISLITYNTLSTTLKHQSIQKQHSQDLTQLQKTLLYFERDFSQVFNQEIQLNQTTISLKSIQNDQLLNIQYQFDSNNIQRQDTSNPETSAQLILLTKLSQFKVRVLDNENKWHNTWRHQDNKNYLKALEIKFTHPYWGEIKKLVAL